MPDSEKAQILHLHETAPTSMNKHLKGVEDQALLFLIEGFQLLVS